MLSATRYSLERDESTIAGASAAAEKPPEFEQGSAVVATVDLFSGCGGLSLRVARAAELLRPGVVLIENVPSVRHDRNQVVRRTVEWLQAVGYHVADQVVRLDRLGIPQRRQRHVLLAGRHELPVDPAAVLAAVVESGNERDLRWAGSTGINPSRRSRAASAASARVGICTRTLPGR